METLPYSPRQNLEKRLGNVLTDPYFSHVIVKFILDAPSESSQMPKAQVPCNFICPRNSRYSTAGNTKLTSQFAHLYCTHYTGKNRYLYVEQIPIGTKNTMAGLCFTRLTAISSGHVSRGCLAQEDNITRNTPFNGKFKAMFELGVCRMPCRSTRV